MKRFGARLLLTIALALVLAVFASGCTKKQPRAEEPTHAERVEAFYNELLALFGDLNLSGDAPQLARNRQHAIERSFEQKYGDLSEYHQLLVGLFTTAEYWTSRSWFGHFDMVTPDEVERVDAAHIPLAFGYAPDDARMRLFFEAYVSKRTPYEGPPKPDPDDVLLDELRLVVRMEPKNGALHLILASHAFSLGEDKEALSELDACNKAPYFRWPDYWPVQRVVEHPPERLSRRQFFNLWSLAPREHYPNNIRMKSFAKELTVATSIGAPISMLTAGLRSMCAMGRDEDVDASQAWVALVLAELLTKYAQGQLYGDLTPKEKAGIDSVVADIHEGMGYFAAYWWPPTEQKFDPEYEDGKTRERLMAKLKADGFTTMDEHEKEMKSRWGNAVFSGSELQMVVENRLCRKELWPIFAKVATFDFEHPERYGAATKK